MLNGGLILLPPTFGDVQISWDSRAINRPRTQVAFLESAMSCSVQFMERLSSEHHRSALPKFDYNLESNIGFFMRPVCDIVCRHRNSSTVHADFLTHNGAWPSTDTILTLTRKSVISIFGFVISDFEHINTDPTMIYLRFPYWNCDSLWTATSAQRGCLIPRPITLFACFNFLPTGTNITNPGILITMTS